MFVKDWHNYQHYRDGSPKWIKLHNSLLDNSDFFKMSITARAALPIIWLVASKTTDGFVTNDINDLAHYCRMPVEEMKQAVIELKQKDFLRSRKTLEKVYTNSMLEGEREGELEKEREKEERESKMGALSKFSSISVMHFKRQIKSTAIVADIMKAYTTPVILADFEKWAEEHTGETHINPLGDYLKDALRERLHLLKDKTAVEAGTYPIKELLIELNKVSGSEVSFDQRYQPTFIDLMRRGYQPGEIVAEFRYFFNRLDDFTIKRAAKDFCGVVEQRIDTSRAVKEKETKAAAAVAKIIEREQAKFKAELEAEQNLTGGIDDILQ